MKCGELIPDGARFCKGCGVKANNQAVQFEQPRQPEPPPKRKKKKAPVIITIIVALIAVSAAFSFFYFRSALGNAPDMRANPRGPERMQASGVDALSRIGASRNTSKYTFLVLGADQGGANTDVIMAVTFDTSAGTLEVASIPRDTMVNVDWRLKKANSIFANMRARSSGERDSESKTMEMTVEAFADVLGYEVDYWVSVDMRAFVSLIDAIGGVVFDVPVNMNYTDSVGGLYINYTAGTHHLSGSQALEVLRFRSGYSNADIGRIRTQQSFLKSAAEQILENRSSLSLTDLANVFINNVKTDLKLSDLIWFGREFMKLDSDSITFHVMPGNASDSVGVQSYVTIYVDEWLELINDSLNPFNNDITTDDVSILTRGADRKLYVTDGNRRGDASWGS